MNLQDLILAARQREISRRMDELHATISSFRSQFGSIDMVLGMQWSIDIARDPFEPVGTLEVGQTILLRYAEGHFFWDVPRQARARAVIYAITPPDTEVPVAENADRLLIALGRVLELIGAWDQAKQQLVRQELLPPSQC